MNYIMSDKGVIYKIIPKTVKVSNDNSDKWESILTLEVATQQECAELKGEN